MLLAAAGFYTYQVNSEMKVGQQREIKSESPCEKEYKSIVRTEANAIILLMKIF